MQGRDLLATNPVLALDGLGEGAGSALRWVVQQNELDEHVNAVLADGVALPHEAMVRWVRGGRLSVRFLDVGVSEPCRGVLGLVHRPFGEGLVVPIQASPSSRWVVEPPLPQRCPQVLDLLQNLCVATVAIDPQALDRHAFPEALGVTLTTRFPDPSDGGSMDVALMLAALGALAPTYPALLRAACAVVQVEGGALRPAGGAVQKLKAFAREAGTGSLLVRTGDCETEGAYDSRFDVVWVVDSVAELSGRLLAAGLLAPFADPTAIGVKLGGQLLTRLSHLAEVQHQHAAAIDFAERLLAASWEPAVPSRMRLAAKEFLPASLRHLGRHGEALSRAVDWRSHVDEHDSFSCEDQARASLEVAASLFDPLRESEALACLRPWLLRIEAEPRLLSARTRVRIWNTAARALSLLGRPGWDGLFEISLALQGRDDPAGVSRTRNYLIQACLRAGQLDRAAEMLDVDPSMRHGEDPAWLGALRADLARRRGRVWQDEELDRREPQQARVNHALGFYLQATARQPIPNAAAADRYQRAATCFRCDVDGLDRANVLWVLVYAMEFAAARERGDRIAAQAAAKALRIAVTQPDLEEFHARVAPWLPKDGSAEIEPLLQQLPWF